MVPLRLGAILVGAALVLLPAAPGLAHIHHKKSEPASTSIVEVAQPASQPTDEPEPIEEEISLGGLLAALGLSALIGACGGLVYAGILGPRKK